MSAIATSRPARVRPDWIRLWPIVPALLFLVIFFLYPVGQLLWLSTVDRAGALTTAHYTRLFDSALYFRVLKITFEIAAWTTVFSIVFGYPVAYYLATSSARKRNTLMLWVLLPFWTSFLVRTFAWIVLLGRNGAINKWLQALGITDAPLSLIYNFAGTMIGMTHAMMPLAIMTMVSVMENIDANLPRAASTLGARGGQAFWRIYFPLSLPGVAAAGLLVFITALGFFITPQLLGGRTETMITQIIINQIQEMMNWSFGGAVSMLLLVTALLVFYLYDRALGMSTLAGGATASQGEGRRNPIAAAAAWLGGRLLDLIGRACDAVAIAWEKIVPPRPDKPRREGSRLTLAVAAFLIIFFLAAPTFFIVPEPFTTDAFMRRCP